MVPFDTDLLQYLEVLVVDDEQRLADTDFGRLFLDRTADGPTLLNWAALVDDIEDAAKRVRGITGRDPGLLSGESVRADGQRVPWAEAAFDESWRRPAHPFFLTYGNWPARRARLADDLADAAHDTTPVAIERLDLATSSPDLREWLGPLADGDSDSVRVWPRTAGHEHVISAAVRTNRGVLRLRLP